MKANLLKGKLVGFFMVLFLLLSLTLVGCSSKTSEEADNTETPETDPKTTTEDDRYGGTLRVVMGETIVNIGVPHLIRARGDIVAANSVYETLGRFDESGKTVPWLAEGWESNPAEKTIKMTLKQGIKFHDGSDFNAEAVKWNLEMFRDAGRAEASAIESVDVVDEYNVQINLSRWDNSIFDNLFSFAHIASPTAYQEKGEEWLQNNPVGTGPFVFSEWIKDEKVTFVRNDNYWIEGQPYLDSVEIQTIGESSTAEAAMMAGDFDVYMLVSPRVANNLSSTFEIEMQENGMGAVGTSMAPDSKNPDSPLADANVRKAIGYAIDKQAIIDTIYYGYGQPAHQWGVEGGGTFSPNVVGTPYDPEKAKELLKAAGYGDGFDLTITVRNDPTLVQMYTAIQAFLAEVGINVELNVAQLQQWQEMSAKEGSWDGLIHSIFRVDNDVIFNFNRNLSKNGSHYPLTHLDEGVEELLATAPTLTTPEEITELSHQLQELVFDEHQASIPLVIEGTLLAQTGKVHDHGFLKTYLSQWQPEKVWIEE